MLKPCISHKEFIAHTKVQQLGAIHNTLTKAMGTNDCLPHTEVRANSSVKVTIMMTISPGGTEESVHCSSFSDDSFASDLGETGGI